MRRVGSAVAAFLVTIGLVGTLTACQPVTPSVDAVHSSFEGFPVISYIPPEPRGLIYVFHGSGGNANVAEKVESVDVLNLFIAAGYGFVSTSSTERTGDRRWDVGDPSMVTNPDLARLARLHADLVDDTAVDATTPLVGIGYSNGSRFVTLWGQAWHDAGYPVRALWAGAGRIARPVTNGGGLAVPTFFSTAENDFTSPPGPFVADYQATVDAGVPATLRISLERPLDPYPYLRIPGIDADEAHGIVDALEATGVWDASGNRVVADIEAAVVQAQTAALPSSVLDAGLADEVASQTQIILAVHTFTAEFKIDAFMFVDAHVS